jgi:predicted metal-dependent hydrolase
MTMIKIDTLIRSKRRTLHLEVGTDAKLTVRAPLRCSNRLIQKFIECNEDWIIRNQKYAQEHCKPFSHKRYTEGEEFLYMGKAYKLITSKAVGDTFAFNGENFVIGESQFENTRELFLRWYKREALKIIAQRVEFYSSISGIKYQKIGITNAHHRWGSCSARGNLNFSWHLIMAPLEIVDYLVIHELTHIKTRNHSKSFWQKVKDYVPDYKRYHTWLKENQSLLSL